MADEEGRWTRADLAAAGLCLAAALAARLPGFTGIELTHYDEAGYAMSARAVADGTFPAQAYPLQHYLSPPLVFGLAGTLMRLLDTGSALVLVGIAAASGAALPVAVFAMGRAAAGRAAGLAAGLFVALSDAHVLFSRVGLTDEPFCAILLCALVAFARAEDRRSLAAALVAGALTGLAWNAKYHGWLACVIAGAALVPKLRTDERAGLASAALRVAAAAAVAAVLYVPWFLHVSAREGGYARLAAEQSTFLHPLGAPRAAAIQFLKQLYLDGWLSRCAPAAAFAAVAAVQGGAAALRNRTVLAVLAALLLAAHAAGGIVILALLAAAGIPRMLRSRAPASRIVLAAFVVFTALTPLYAPYVRLLLPWLVAAALLAGAGLSDLAARAAGRDDRRHLRGAVIAGLAAAVVLAVTGPRDAPRTWERGVGFRSASAAVASRLHDGETAAVIGEPAVVWYLRGLGRRAEHLDDPGEVARHEPPGTEVVVVFGRYGRLAFERWRRDRGIGVEPLGTFPVAVGEVRRLDDFLTGEMAERRSAPRGAHDLEAFRLRVPAGAAPPR